MVRNIKKNMFTAVLGLILGPQFVNADQESAIGVSDAEIRIGNIMHYRPAGDVREDWKSRSGLFDMIKDNGRRLSC